MGSSSTPEYGTDSPSAGHGICENSSGSVYYSTSERKKSKKKKKKKDREKRHKSHHKDKSHRHRHRGDESSQEQLEQQFPVLSPEHLEENMLHFGDLKTIDCVGAKPVTRPMVPLLISPKSIMSGNESDSQPLLSPTSSIGGGGGRASLEKAGSESGREPRTCVLKLKASQTPLGKVISILFSL